MKTMNSDKHAEKKNISKEQEEYLSSIKKKKLFIKICQILLLLIFLLTWEITAKYHIINDFIFCSPSKLFTTLVTMIKDGSLIYHIGISLFETLLSFLIVIVGSLLIATLFWWNDSPVQNRYNN